MYARDFRGARGARHGITLRHGAALVQGLTLTEVKELLMDFGTPRSPACLPCSPSSDLEPTHAELRGFAEVIMLKAEEIRLSVAMASGVPCGTLHKAVGVVRERAPPLVPAWSKI